MLAHSWPGNVRELVNAVKHCAVLSRGADVDVPDLHEALWQPMTTPLPVASTGAASTFVSLANVERRHTTEVLRVCGGKSTDAARIRDIGRTTLWRRMKAHGLAEAS